MTPIKRPLATAGAAVLLALSLTACGGAPTDASEEDFCDAVGKTVEVIGSVEGDEPTEEEWEKVQGAYEDLGDVGTPEDIGEDERNGFEVVVDAITGLDYDEAKKSFGEEDGSDEIPGVSKDDEKDADRFFEYVGTTCQDQLTPDSGSDDATSDDATSDEATEIPTEDLPTDVPSIDPSDIPTELSPEDLASLQEELEKLTESATTE